jgi:hypothetical protein
MGLTRLAYTAPLVLSLDMDSLSMTQLRDLMMWAREHVEQPSENPDCTWHPRYGWLVTSERGALSARRQNKNHDMDERITMVRP